MPEERAMESLTPPRDSNGRSSRPEFVEFRNRIRRLVESLVGLRSAASEGKSWRKQERVEVKLESAAVGKPRWYYQEIPDDVWDFDSSYEVLLMDRLIRGQMRKILVHMNKSGLTFVQPIKLGWIQRSPGQPFSSGFDGSAVICRFAQW